MRALEWNPAFSPIVTALIILGAGLFFYLLLPRLITRHGRTNAWLLLLPKIAIAVLIIVALLDPDLRLSGWNSTPTRVLILRDISSSMDLRDDGANSRNAPRDGIISRLESAAPPSIHFEVLPFDTSLHEAGYSPKTDAVRGTDLRRNLPRLRQPAQPRRCGRRDPAHGRRRRNRRSARSPIRAVRCRRPRHAAGFVGRHRHSRR